MLRVLAVMMGGVLLATAMVAAAFLISYPKGFDAEMATLLASRRAPAVPSQPKIAARHAPGTVFRDCADCPEMVAIPPGQFVMGTEAAEAAREKLPDARAAQERPRHPVNVSSAFALGKFPVTRGEYTRFVQATGRSDAGCYVWTGSKFDEDGSKSWRNPGFAQSDRDPVVCVNWDDAKAYVAWLSQATGKGYRLPNEAEWEYAARAGTTTARWWGDDIGRNLTNCCCCGSQWDKKSTSPVGSFRANAFGLFDMLGNAWQWVEDCWSENYNGAPSDASIAQVSGDCGRRVLRGGSWLSGWSVRAGSRDRDNSGDRIADVGFRVARTE